MVADVTHNNTSFLTHIWIDITSKCNNRCPYCYDMGNQNCDVELSRLKKIFTLVKEINPPNIILIGGEPTLHKNFIQVLKLANEVVSPTIVTNGTMFSKQDFCEKVFNIGISGILFSLTSPFEDVHDATTGRTGSFQELLQGINNAKKYLPSNRIRTSTTITKNNYKNLCDVIDLSRKLGLYRSIFNACVPSLADPSGTSCLNLDELSNAIENLYLYSKNLNHSIKIATNLPFCVFSDRLREELRNEHVVFTHKCQLFCGSGYEFLSDGSIIPCTHLHDCILGNPIEQQMNSKKFFEFLNSKELNDFRNNLLRYPSEECENCSEWGNCVGGCPLMWSAFDANKYLKAIK